MIPALSTSRPVASVLFALAILIAPLGVVWHELAGHALVGLFCGGRVTRVQCLGVQFVPSVAWTGMGEGLGVVDVVDVPTQMGEHVTQLAGSANTLVAAGIALLLLRRRRARGAARVALTCVGLWALDLVTFTLPSLGLRRYLLFGTTYSEPYDAAVALGIPGPLFQVLAIGGSLSILVGFFLPLRERSPRTDAKRRHGFRVSRLVVRGATVLPLLVMVAGAAWLVRRIPRQTFAQAPATNWARDPSARVQEWQEDVDTLARELVARHRNAFFQCRRQDFDAAVTALRDSVPHSSDGDVVVGLMKLVAMIGDAHTAIDVGSLLPSFRRFPLSIYIFSDGPVIYAAGESQKDLIGCTLVSFAGVSADEAFRRVAVTSACENEATFLDKAPRLLCVPEIVHAVGLIPTTGEVAVVVRDRQGQERSVELKALSPSERLVGAEMEEAKLPLSRQRRPHTNWFQVLPERKALYLRYNTCEDETDQTVASLASQMLDAIDANHLDRVIVDLRGNGGGNSGLLDPFLTGLGRRSKQLGPGHIVALIGRRTFSSAHMHAVDLKENYGAVLIGEPTGQKPNAYGEVRFFVLPHSQIPVRYSTKFWHTATGDPPSLEPDRLVLTSSSDYFAMRDPVLDAALE